MDKKRLEWKVGLFVFIGLGLLALLLVQFSKSATLWKGTYEVHLKATNVGALKRRSSVLLAGVQVGSVSEVKLAQDGKSVTLILKIYDGTAIYSDAKFVIEQSNFLGDQYVGIMPMANVPPVLTNNALVTCEPPFNIQEVARNAAGFIARIDQTAQRLNEAIADVRRLVLNEQTLTNLAVTVANLRVASDRAITVVDNVNFLIDTNKPAITEAISNVVFFSEQINAFADEFRGVMNTNSTELTIAMKNISESSTVLKTIFDEAQAGKGLLGNVLKNDQLSTNVSAIAANLSITTSNLNRLGLWGILWAKKPPKSPPPPR